MVAWYPTTVSAISARYRRRWAGTIGDAWVDRRPAAGGNTPSVTTSPFVDSSALRRWNSAVTPSSLNREAMVPNTGSRPFPSVEGR